MGSINLTGVTDHALLRYMERVHGLDVDGMKRSLLTPEIRSAIRSGATRYKKDGVQYIIANRAIVTVLTDGTQRP